MRAVASANVCNDCGAGWTAAQHLLMANPLESICLDTCLSTLRTLSWHVRRCPQTLQSLHPSANHLCNLLALLSSQLYTVLLSPALHVTNVAQSDLTAPDQLQQHPATVRHRATWLRQLRRDPESGDLIALIEAV